MKKVFTQAGLKLVSIWFLIAILSVYGYLWFIKTPTFMIFEKWVQSNLVTYFSFVVLTKALAIVWPPLPGNLFTITSIPFWGWFIAYLADFLGSLLGSSVAYYLGKKYGFRFINKVFSTDMESKIRGIKVKSRNEIESVFMIKTLGGGLLMEAVSYGAGILNIKYINFLIGSILSHLLFGIPIFFLADQILDSKNAIWTLMFVVISLVLLWKLKGRYFE